MQQMASQIIDNPGLEIYFVNCLQIGEEKAGVSIGKGGDQVKSISIWRKGRSWGGSGSSSHRI